MIEEIATRAASLSFNDLSDGAKERLTLCLLANLSVGIAGVPYCVLPEPAASRGRYRLLSGGMASDARAASFWNAAVMHARTQDDFHPVGNLHVGTVVLPALLAVADEMPMSGREFLEALAVGYMVAVGMSRAFSSRTTPRGVRSTGYYAPFGATAAVARARGLDAGRIASALALTTVFAAGTTQAWIDGSDEWQLHPAHGSESAHRAVELALAGVRGGKHALDGKAGFYHALLGEDVTFEEIAGDFDPSVAIEESVIKRFPVSGICQAVVLAAERAAQKMGDPGNVARILVEMNAFEMRYPGTQNSGPVFRSFGDRLMSAPFCTAAVLSRGRLSFDDFHGAANGMCDALVAKVSLREDTALPLLSARTTVHMTDGKSIVEEVLNSRDQVRIDWQTVTPWGVDLWAQAGRGEADFRASYDAVRDLASSPTLDLGPWHEPQRRTAKAG